jgi:hypothetical protein
MKLTMMFVAESITLPIFLAIPSRIPIKSLKPASTNREQNAQERLLAGTQVAAVFHNLRRHDVDSIDHDCSTATIAAVKAVPPQ